MVAQSKSVQTRAWVRGAFAGTKIGERGYGRLVRCNVDQDGQTLEASFAETRTWTLSDDANGQANQRGQEVWSFTGPTYAGEIERGLSTRGSGINDTMTAVNADDSLLANSSFSDRAGVDDTHATSITGWGGDLAALAGTGADVVVDRVNYYQASKGESSPGCLQVLSHSLNFWQYLAPQSGQTAVVKTKLKADRPYDHSIAVSPSGTLATGALNWVGTCKPFLGSYSTTYPLTGVKPVVVIAGGGSVTNGDHYLVYTMTTNGIEGPPSPVSSVVTAGGGNNTINVSFISVGPAGTSKRTVYMTAAAASSTNAASFKKVADINDNATTVLAITIADGSLGAVLPWGELPDANGYLVIPALPPSTSATSSTQKNRWMKQWSTDQAQAGFTFTWTSGASFLADRAILTELKIADGTEKGSATSSFPADWVLPRSGSTPWPLNTTMTVADSETAGAYIQEWIGRRYARSFPSSGSPTVAEPTTP